LRFAEVTLMMMMMMMMIYCVWQPEAGLQRIHTYTLSFLFFNGPLETNIIIWGRVRPIFTKFLG